MKKLLIFGELLLVGAIAGALLAALGIDPNDPTVTARDAVGVVAGAGIAGLYGALRLAAPFALAVLASAKESLLASLKSDAP